MKEQLRERNLKVRGQIQVKFKASQMKG